MSAISKSNIATNLCQSIRGAFNQEQTQRMVEVLTYKKEYKTRDYPLSSEISNRYGPLVNTCLKFSRESGETEEIAITLLEDKRLLLEFTYNNKDAIENLRSLGKSDSEKYEAAITELGKVNQNLAALVRFLSDPSYETYGNKPLPSEEIHMDALSKPQKETFQEIVEKTYIERGTRMQYLLDADRLHTIDNVRLKSVLQEETDNKTRQRLYFSITQSFPNAVQDFLYVTSEELKKGKFFIRDTSNGKTEKPTLVVDEFNKTTTLSQKIAVVSPIQTAEELKGLSPEEDELGVKIISESLLEAVYSWERGELLSIRNNTTSGLVFFPQFEDGTVTLPPEFSNDKKAAVKGEELSLPDDNEETNPRDFFEVE